MKIVFLDNKREMCLAWAKYFKGIKDIEIKCCYFQQYDLKDIECIVSPANAYGLMNGGYDMAITEVFGEELQLRVQDYIIANYCGEQLVGSSFIVDIPNTNKKLIHTPTMIVPTKIVDSKTIYTSMRSTLLCALKNNVKSIVIPAFGGQTGQLPFQVIAKEMYLAYIQIFGERFEVRSWDDVDDLEDYMEDMLKGR